MLERHQAADDRLFPNGQSHAVSVLQRKRGLFVGKSELLGFGPDGGDLGDGAAGSNQFDGRIQILATALVGIDHRVRRVSDAEAAVITSAVSHVRMQDVVVDRISRTQYPVRKNV